LSYSIRLVGPEVEHTIECREEWSILDEAARQGLTLPAVCRGGSCCTCLGQLIDGVPPDQSEQSYLSAEDLAKGYLLLCVAYPTGDCSIRTHKTNEYLEALANDS
jgi:ferredoxin